MGAFTAFPHPFGPGAVIGLGFAAVQGAYPRFWQPKHVCEFSHGVVSGIPRLDKPAALIWIQLRWCRFDWSPFAAGCGFHGGRFVAPCSPTSPTGLR